MKEQEQARTTPGARPLTRRQMAMKERSHRARRVLWIFIAIAILIGITIPATGYYIVFVRPLQEKIVTVNNVTYDMGYVLKRARRTLIQAASFGESDPAATTDVIMGVLQEIQNDQMLLQAAPRLGITVSDQEIHDRLSQELGSSYVGEDDKERAGDSFDQLYKQRLNVLQMSDKDYKDIVRARLISDKLEARLKAELPVHDEQVHVFVITVKSQTDAQKVLARLKAGEDFGFVARDVSTDTSTKDLGGDWGWYAKGMKPDFENTWFAMSAGQLSAPVYLSDTIYIFKVAEHEDARELTDDQRNIMGISRLNTWLEEERDRVNINQVWGQSYYLYVHDKLYNDPILKAQREEQQKQQEAQSGLGG